MPPLKLSVVTVSLNQAAYIEANIRSVLAQAYPGVEHIVVDGGSTDGTLDILKRYPHLRWISEPDTGQSNALNKGIAMATGEIVGWLNSDDTYEPGAFAARGGSVRRPEREGGLRRRPRDRRDRRGHENVHLART